MAQNKYFIQEFLSLGKVYHGGIGCQDAERVLLRNGYKPIIFPFPDQFSLKAKLLRLIFCFRTFLTLPRNSIVVFSFDTYVFLHKWLIKLLRRRKSITIICFLIDIEGMKDNDPMLLRREISFLKKMKYFIVHNNRMKSWVEGILPNANIAEIDFFDFLTQPGRFYKREKNKMVIFAGNLEKSTFLRDLRKLCHGPFEPYFTIYGTGATDDLINQPNLNYEGVYDPYELPSKLSGTFGLIWDGECIEGLEGVYGEYLKYISPHKLSLYIVAGIPVITHHEAACAELVIKYDIGFTINSLFDISGKIESISDERYMSMQKNCLHLAEKISKGYCLENALKKMEQFKLSF